MTNSFTSLLQYLQSLLFQFDEQHVVKKINILQRLSVLSWKTPEQLFAYQEVLLFMLSHPDNQRVLQHCKKEIKRIATILKTSDSATYQDSGLPFTNLQTRFSHDLMTWLHQQRECRLELDSFEDKGTALNELLRLSLPAIERDETTAGLDNMSLLEALDIKPQQQVSFLLDQFNAFHQQALTKDFLWESMKPFFTIRSVKSNFSRLENRIEIPSLYYHSELMKRFDANALLDAPLPQPEKLNAEQASQVIKTIRYSLALTLRETDPATYIEPQSLRLYHLERGISVALYGMQADRQLALQSYVGYTLFKNAYPIAYGGSWIFGQRANFGLNIFEAFRGGESGYVMCQLLRTYLHAFSLTHIEVEPYQYGLDNPDGIASGAFWFYYKYGFRPVDVALNELAQREHHKIQTKKGYRSHEKILLRFTECNIALHRERTSTPAYGQVAENLSRLIRKTFKGQRSRALDACREIFKCHFKTPFSYTQQQSFAFDDVALLSAAMNFTEEKSLNQMKEMVLTKDTNPYRYNQLLIQLFQDAESYSI